MRVKKFGLSFLIAVAFVFCSYLPALAQSSTHRVEANSTNRHTMYLRDGQNANISINGDGDTDLDLYVFDPSGDEVARDISTDDQDAVSFSAESTGNYRVEVRNLGNVWNRYQLSRRTSGNTGGTGGGGSGEIGNARLTRRAEANGTNRHVMYVRGRGQRITVRINGDDDTDLDLFIFDPSGNEVARDISTDDDETASFVAQTTGTYRVEIRNLGNVWNEYQVWRTIGGGGGGGNNSGSIGGGRLSRRVAANSTNTHTMYVQNGQRISVRLTGDGDTDLDLFIFDPSGNQVGSDLSTDDDETASFVARRAGTYRVEIRNLGNVWNGYEIWREIRGNGGGSSGGGGGGVISYARTSHRVEANAMNRHTIYVRAGEYVALRINGDNDTDLDLFLADPEGEQVASDVSLDDDEFVSFTARRTGTYTVEVRNLGNVWNGYQMWRER